MTFLLVNLAGKCGFNRSLSPLFIFTRGISKSYYDILKVSPTCTAKEIRDAFIILSKQNHPDRHLNDPSMHEKFVQINEAYSTLINPSARRAYDLSLSQKRKLGPPYDRPQQGRQSTTHTQTFYRNQTDRERFYRSKGPEWSWDRDQGGRYVTWTEWAQAIRQGRPFHAFSKKLSSSMVVILLLSFTLIGVLIQVVVIRHSFLVNQEKMLEKSRQYQLVHSLAREKAKLYGNAQQIEMLKKQLNMEDGGGEDTRTESFGSSEAGGPLSSGLSVDGTDVICVTPVIRSSLSPPHQHSVPKGGAPCSAPHARPPPPAPAPAQREAVRPQTPSPQHRCSRCSQHGSGPRSSNRPQTSPPAQKVASEPPPKPPQPASSPGSRTRSDEAAHHGMETCQEELEWTSVPNLRTEPQPLILRSNPRLHTAVA